MPKKKTISPLVIGGMNSYEEYKINESNLVNILCLIG